MKNIGYVLVALLGLSSAMLGQGINGARGTIYTNEGSTGTTTGLLAVSSGADNTAINAGTATAGILGVCIQGCGTTGQSVVADFGDILCQFSGTATDGHYVQAAGTGSKCVDGGATRPTTGGEILGTVKKGGSGVGTYLVHWRANASASTGGGSVNVNGSTVSSPNFNGSTPAAEAGKVNVTFQVSGSSVSGEVPSPSVAANLPATGTYPAGATVNMLFPVVLFNGLAQGVGPSTNGSCPTISGTNYCPIDTLVAGTATTPQFGAAAFAYGSIGPTVYKEFRYTLPSDFKANSVASITAVVHVDTDTTNTHTITPDIKLACDGADGSTIQPTYGAAQTMPAVTIGSSVKLKFTSTLATPTITCAADQTLFVRFEINATTVNAGNILLDALKMSIVRSMVTQ